MRKTKKFAAVMAVALGVGITPYANAVIEHHPGGRGDALLFPVFYGNGENYFTISNSSNVFIQGHIRFRGAAWSGELLDFDVILTPGDVFVFRLADVDGDGLWEIDQSLDPNNFAYTGMLRGCGPEAGTNGVSVNNCMDHSNRLIPEVTSVGAEPRGAISPELIAQHRALGYVEFIGEGVLNGMTHAAMNRLIDPKLAGQLANTGQRVTGNKSGTHLWSWVLSNGDPMSNNTGQRLKENDYGPFFDTTPAGTATAATLHTAADVPNALSGTAFITQAGQKYGIAYNAEALVNFRTNTTTPAIQHRINNYTTLVNMGVPGATFVYPPAAPIAQNGVILHNESASANPSAFAYVYGYGETCPGPNASICTMESRISFNNTWGPTLADGDDYNLDRLRITDATGVHDSFDNTWGNLPNSVAEVEEAIRDGVQYIGVPSIPSVNAATPADGSSPRQLFTGFYFDGAAFDKACEGNGRQGNPSCSDSGLHTWYFAFFPTKFFYGENFNWWRDAQGNCADPASIGCNRQDQLFGRQGYLRSAVEHLLTWAKPINVNVWDIFENSPSTPTSDTSPSAFEPPQLLPLREELSVFSITDIKNKFVGTAHQDWTEGRVALQVPADANLCRNDPTGSDGQGGQSPQNNNCVVTYPVLMYSFDWADDGYLAHWRPLER